MKFKIGDRVKDSAFRGVGTVVFLPPSDNTKLANNRYYGVRWDMYTYITEDTEAHSAHESDLRLLTKLDKALQ